MIRNNKKYRDAYYYTENLHSRLKDIDEPILYHIHDGIEHYATEYAKHKKEVGAASVAKGFQEEVQRVINSSEGKFSEKIQCKKGCSFCCNYHVDITDDEAELIVEHISENNIQIDRERLERQSQKSVGTWKELPIADKRCVMLDDKGCCRIYDVRPIPCRTLHVVTDPKHCDNEDPSGIVAKASDIDVDLIATGVLNATRSDSMAKMLIEKIKLATNEA